MAVPNTRVAQRMRAEIQQWQQEEQRRGFAPRTSSFRPHHSITVRGPDLQLVGKYRDDARKDYVGISPPRVAQRCDPFDWVVYDKATLINQGRRDRGENTFTSIERVDSDAHISDEAFASLRALPVKTASEFWTFLNAVQAWAGETLLRVVSYQDAWDVAGRLVRTVMLARTVFPMANGRACMIERYLLTRRSPQPSNGWPLDGPFSHPALTAPGQRQWARDLVDVLSGDSIRGLKHRMIEYELTYDQSDPAPVHNMDGDGTAAADLHKSYSFRARREEDHEDVLRAKFSPIHPGMLPQESTDCTVCTNEFEWDPQMEPIAQYTSGTFADTDFPDWSRDPVQMRGPYIAVELPCPAYPRHYICHSCLIRLAFSEGLGMACPFCRAPIYNARELDQLVYGITLNPAPTCTQDQYIYQHNPDKWTGPENIQRAMSDLDRYFATEYPVWELRVPTNNTDMLFDLWLDLIKLDDTYPDNPDHRCTLKPEWPRVVDILHQQFQLPVPPGVSQVDYFVIIKSGMTRQLHQCMQPRQHLYNAALRGSQPGDATAMQKMKVWPRGMEEFVDRSLSRLINFVRLRACDCQVNKDTNRWNGDRMTRPWQEVYTTWAKHYHGDRVYYSPEAYNKLMLPGEAWRM